jgi:hypothetical protein
MGNDNLTETIGMVTRTVIEIDIAPRQHRFTLQAEIKKEDSHDNVRLCPS